MTVEDRRAHDDVADGGVRPGVADAARPDADRAAGPDDAVGPDAGDGAGAGTHDHVAGPRPDYLRAARSPRMLGLLLIFLLAAAVCGRLGAWQLDRAFERGEQNAAAEVAAVTGAPAVPLADALAPQTTFPGSLVGTKVTVTGSFEGETLLVPGRAHEGEVGHLVLDAFRVTATDALLPVVRGWVAAPDAPAPEAGEVTLEGFLQAGEAADPARLPDGRIGAVSPGELVNLWGGPMYTGYLVVAHPTEPGIAVLRPPSLPGGGLDIQNLAYALQWWIFGLFAVLLWARFVRDEARAVAEEAAEA